MIQNHKKYRFLVFLMLLGSAIALNNRKAFGMQLVFEEEISTAEMTRMKALLMLGRMYVSDRNDSLHLKKAQEYFHRVVSESPDRYFQMVALAELYMLEFLTATIPERTIELISYGNQLNVYFAENSDDTQELQFICEIIESTQLQENSAQFFSKAACLGYIRVLEFLHSLFLYSKITALNLDSHDKFNRTALHYAVMNGHFECTDFLIANGADIHWRDREGLTSLRLACLFAYSTSDRAPCPIAEKYSNTPVTISDEWFCLLRRDCTSLTGKTNDLSHSTFNAYYSLIELLIAKGGRVHDLTTNELNLMNLYCPKVIDLFRHKLGGESNSKLVIPLPIERKQPSIQSSESFDGIKKMASEIKDCQRILYEKKIAKKDLFFNRNESVVKIIEHSLHVTSERAEKIVSSLGIAPQVLLCDLSIDKLNLLETEILLKQRVEPQNDISTFEVEQRTQELLAQLFAMLIELSEPQLNDLLDLRAFNNDTLLNMILGALLHKGHFETARRITKNRQELGDCQALHWASKNGYIKIVTLLANEQNIDLRDEKGITPLHYASQEGHLDIVRYFIEEKNVSPTSIGRKFPGKFASFIDKLNPFSEAVSNLGTSLHYACKTGQIAIARYLLFQTGKNSVNIGDGTGTLPLHVACYMQNLPLIAALVSHGGRIDETDKFGKNALQIAVDQQNLEMVILLVNLGANTNSVSNGITVLMKAILNEQYAIALYLLEKGANPNAIFYTQETTPLGTLKLDKGNCFHLAIRKGVLSLVNAMIQKITNINHRCGHGETAFFIAASHGHEEILRLLKQHGADHTITTYGGISALHKACQNNHLSVVRYLVEELHFNANELPFNKEHNCSNQKSGFCHYLHDRLTPLHVACKYGHGAIVRYLIDNKVYAIDVLSGECDQLDSVYTPGSGENSGWDHTIRKTRGAATPLYIACLHQQKEIVEYLLEQSANVNMGMKEYSPTDKSLFSKVPARTPLEVAYGNNELVRLLIKYHADTRAIPYFDPEYCSKKVNGEDECWKL